MNSLLLALICFAGYIVAYNTYGRYLANRIFNLNTECPTPAHTLADGQDYIPANKEVLFGHHFTSIAGLGPNCRSRYCCDMGMGPPALIWVLIGPIFLGGVHDFGSLVISMRAKGRSIGDITAELVNPRVRTLFMIIIFLELWIVIGVFALIIALLFNMYPQAVFSIWAEIPIALWLGWMVYRRNHNPLWPSIFGVVLLYAAIVLGTYFPIRMPAIGFLTPVMVWMFILFFFNSFLTSILPVNVLLQPRDYINAHELLIILFLITLGTIVGHPPVIAPAFQPHPAGAPPMWPFLFVIIACGAISGFHSLVSSGTSSKQLDCEGDAKAVGYGSMLMEGALSVLVIIAITAGLGMRYTNGDGLILTGRDAFSSYYVNWAAAQGLASNINAFIVGSSNLMETFGIPVRFGLTIMGVFLVSFAATTLDTATRLQRYVVSEFAEANNIPVFHRRLPATLFAVLTAAGLAFYDGTGQGALTLWPLFGTVNQLLAALALLLVSVYFVRVRKPVMIAFAPFLFMVVMTGWAMVINIGDYFTTGNWLLFIISIVVFALEIWMIIESAIVLSSLRSHGVVAEAMAFAEDRTE